MIRFRELHFSYRPGEPVLNGADLALGAGLTLVLGPNGSGKSTLLKIASGVERPDRGIAEIEGHDLWKEEVAARRSLVYVPEQPDLTPYATIRDVVNLVCRLRSVSLGQGQDALLRVGLLHVAGRSIRELSAGQRRRAVLAAAWIGLPRVVLLDEPLESMDRAMRAEILLWIDGLLTADSAVVVSTHEIEPFLVKAACAVTIMDGRIREYDSLPADSAQRMAFLDALSRGADTGRVGPRSLNS
jgi:ABC-type multidrug transport system ATPase subunit